LQEAPDIAAQEHLGMDGHPRPFAEGPVEAERRAIAEALTGGR